MTQTNVSAANRRHQVTRIIAFSGPKKSGKDTAARYLFARNSFGVGNYFKQLNFADTLKRACMEMFGLSLEEVSDPILKETVLDRWPHTTPRQLLQDVAKLMRTFYGGRIWVDRWCGRMDDRFRNALEFVQCVVVTDLRHPEELEELQKRKAKIVYVQNDVVDAQLRQERAAGDALSSDVSESHYAMMRAAADHILFNNGSITELHSNMRTCTKELFPDWKDWQ